MLSHPDLVRLLPDEELVIFFQDELTVVKRSMMNGVLPATKTKYLTVGINPETGDPSYGMTTADGFPVLGNFAYESIGANFIEHLGVVPLAAMVVGNAEATITYHQALPIFDGMEDSPLKVNVVGICIYSLDYRAMHIEIPYDLITDEHGRERIYLLNEEIGDWSAIRRLSLADLDFADIAAVLGMQGRFNVPYNRYLYHFMIGVNKVIQERQSNA